MRVCFFGNYISGYSRIEVFKKGLEKNGVQILECHTRKKGFLKYWELYRKHALMRNQYDAMLVGMASYSVVWWAWLLTDKRIVFDAFVSLYLTEVEDRRKVFRGSLKARYLAFLEKLSCKLADIVLLDTEAQIDYFVERYGVPREKFVRIFVGADDEIFSPNSAFSNQKSEFIVHWHGYITLFHGLETVIEAAKLLTANPEIRFQIVTRFNSRFEKIQKIAAGKGLQNIDFLPEIDNKNLAVLISRADVSLGVFGKNLKAQTVIPNKIYEAVACQKPVITGRQKVLEELFSDMGNIIMVEAENPADLAEKILQLKNDNVRRAQIGKSAYELYQSRLTPKILGQELKNVLL